MIKQPKYFLIRCKKCGNKMKYMTYDPITSLSTKSKKCVYCGFTNNVKKSLIAETDRVNSD
jgi:predicted nucleic-acid-binding Zn-ribbon protein